ncbi:MAG TPA: amino acid ABC transporter substrate-binding protein [Anaerolineae bacterium]|nr:amino acid ABC transporter substrate-binding protein [Anaerolineae bacterium]
MRPNTTPLYNLFRRSSILLVFFSLLILSCTTKNATWQRIEQNGILRVGLDPSYPPFENLLDDQLVGIDIDLLNAMGDGLGLTVQFDIIGYDGLYDALLTGRVDVLASALIIDETRTKEFAYSDSYFNAGQVLVTAVGSAIEQLDGQVVAVELGAGGHVVATERQKQGATFEIVVFDSAENALLALTQNKATVTLTDSVSARLFIAQHPNLQISDPAITVEPYALATRRADKQLLAKLNTRLQNLVQSGQLELIIERELVSEAAVAR